ncbi:sensor histidine kinase [Solirubrobacter phytolaccae]|uniref:histidine kinase n=1 Tax=Solirubrobacter phytolaccae TaxID=1404360 RepID=A0A9X3N4P1_9ACTN|nr:sensor histidine kinase [Solirubrobacter phytolaccae]MDA0179446.1 sensor histidine kinase [Solirubrobacter phytolaccae]
MSWVRPTRGDLLLAGVATLFGVVSVLIVHPAPGSGVRRDADVWGVLLAVLATAPLALRRAAPLPIVVATGLGLVVAAARGYPLAAAGLGPALATTSAAYLTDRRGTILAGATFLLTAVTSTALALRGDPLESVQIATVAVIGVLAAAVGDILRTLRARNAELDALRAIEAREAVAQERVRIARDVHDVVGHALAGIALQARAGRRLLERDTARTAEALREIDELATRALGETRDAIGRIRMPDQPAELQPQPRLDDLDDLVARLHDEELEVQLRREGDAGAVPAFVQASAYRIVQEALNNVIKHARPAHAVVTIAARADGMVEIDVRDDGRRGPTDDGRGHGLRGMRERAAQHGGSLEAGPGPDGGWRVHARLPAGGRAAR